MGSSVSGYTCVKFLFFGFNVIFWLLGCGILGVGIWLHVAKGSYGTVMPSFHFLSLTALCIAAGIIVLVVGFFGCCGAIMENQCMLLMYFLLVVLIFILEIVAGILAFIYRQKLLHVVHEELLVGIQTDYQIAQEDGLREAWDSLQQELQCCGVSNYTDWYNIGAWKGKHQVPASCCLPEAPSNCDTARNPDDWYRVGCMKEIQSVVTQNLYIIGVVGLSVGVLQVLGLVAAMALFCCVRSDREEKHNVYY